MTLTRASSIPEHHPNRVQAEDFVGAGNSVSMKKQPRGWGEVYVGAFV